jgi:hypothetical protein
MSTPEETAIINLTDATTLLLDSVNFSKDGIDAQIASAVVISENNSQIPLAQMAVSMVSMNTLIVNLITESTQ